MAARFKGSPLGFFRRAGVLAILAAAPSGPAAADPADTQPAGLGPWIIDQMQGDAVVDIAHYPGCAPDPGRADAWGNDKCSVGPGFLQKLLTGDGKSGMPQHGLHLAHATITGDLDLSDDDIGESVDLEDSVVHGSIRLSDSRLHRLLKCGHCDVDGAVAGMNLVAESGVSFDRNSEIDGGAEFSDAVIHGDLDFATTTLYNGFTAFNLRVDDDLLLSDDPPPKGRALIVGDVQIGDSQIGGSLILKNQEIARFTGKDSKPAGGGLYVRGTLIEGSLRAEPVLIKGDVDLYDSVVNDTVGFDNAEIDGAFTGENLHTQGALFLRSGRVLGAINLSDSRLDRGLVLDLSTISQLDLTLAQLEELRLDGTKWQCPDVTDAKPKPLTWTLGDASWLGFSCDASGTQTFRSLPNINLRNAHILGFPTAPLSWPPRIDARGFTFDRLGGSDDEPGETSRRQWLDWLERDPSPNTQRYVQVADVLAAEGDRDTADYLLYAARVRDRDQAWRDLIHPGRTMKEALRNGEAVTAHGNRSFAHRLLRWLFLMLGWGIGYGIGLYSFFALLPLVFLTLVGTVTLYFSPRLREAPILVMRADADGRLAALRARSLAAGFIWRAGASFQKVLPLIEYYAPFKAFLDNPKPEAGQRRNLTGTQAAIFSVLSILGWVLGGFVAAAVSGLTQKG
jgi:hypothetical protein